MSNANSSLRYNRGNIKSHYSSKKANKRYTTVRVGGESIQLSDKAAKRAADAMKKENRVLLVVLSLILIIAVLWVIL